MYETITLPSDMWFNTPMYNEAMKLCWNIGSYKSQIAVVVELLKLQKDNQIPPEVTADDMMNLLLEESEKEMRACVFKFGEDGYFGDDAIPLFMLMWNVNTGNKIRDIVFEAQMLFKSPGTLPSFFQLPEVVRMAQDYAKILRDKPQEASSSRLLSVQQVVEDVVPRVLQIFWVFPLQPSMNMRSEKISKISVWLTMTTFRRVSRALSGGEQVTFSHSVRDDIVLSILIEIRQMYPLEVLLKKIKEMSLQLLTEVTDVAVGQITQMFQSQRVAVSQTPSVESPATYEGLIDLFVTEEQPTPMPEGQCFVAVVLSSPSEYLPFPPPPSPSDPTPFSPPTSHSEPPSSSEIQTEAEVDEESAQENPSSRQCTRKRKSFFQNLCCCFADSDTDTE
ncbi:uncharacterized protein LOC125007775 [Mugil cephalus]|uniref:uncharacterized protein LOC125007775 n=1 Tax=Mugil cephalus TaxID=48193 RepID=UPI001FB6FA91|nr:uncharacterized protein LOC125007775 [Mugil cephalus]